MIATRFHLAASRPLWLTTLADLSLLLVGFFVFLQASQHVDRAALADGLRAGFDAPPAPPMTVEGAMIAGFAAGSAALPPDTRRTLAWLRQGARDPRIGVTLTGATDGDVDPVTGSAAILASDRARAVAAAILADGAVRPDQLRFDPPTTGLRGVHIDLGFAGMPARQGVAARQLPPAAPTGEP